MYALRTAPLSVYNENLSFQSGSSPLRGLEVESYHSEMTHRKTRSTLAVRFSRVGNYYFSPAQSPTFSRKTENEQSPSAAAAAICSATRICQEIKTSSHHNQAHVAHGQILFFAKSRRANSPISCCRMSEVTQN